MQRQICFGWLAAGGVLLAAQSASAQTEIHWWHALTGANNDVTSTTGSFTANFGSITLDHPDRHEAMAPDGDYDIEFQVAGGIPWPDGYSMYKVGKFNFNVGTYRNNPMVFFRDE